MTAKPLPLNAPTSFDVARVEIKKTLPATADKAAATVLKLGLIGPGGEKGYAEFFLRDGDTPPGEGTKETLIIDPPKQDGWLPSAKRPRSGGGGGRAPKDSNSIEAQCAFKGAIELIVAGKAELENVGNVTQQCVDAIRGAKA